ncbi:MAG: dihydrodipicolinate reductase [Acidobacteriota bacterium]|nr:dihydrodipicolinate reductase [Acidobacteriota bacterium]
MKIAIVGYGKMGKLIERIALERGHEAVLKLDEFNNAQFEGLTAENFRGVDVAIDFSIPSAAVTNIEKIAALKVNLVVGTTGWAEQTEHVRKVVEQNGVGLIWSPNFSIGVRVFTQVLALAAKLMADESEYEAWAWEIHHSAKKDAPSGTLLKLVEEMKSAGFTKRIDVSSNRAGAIPGTHEIGFDSPADTITLRHTARSREGFALGAVKAAESIQGKTGFHKW